MRLVYSLLLLLLLTACGVNPVTGKHELQLTSEKEEIAIGEKNFESLQQVLGGPYNADPKAQDYLQKVGKKLVKVSDRPHLPYEFILVNSSEINAATLPGGKIVVNRGILTKLHNEAELAALLGHEIVHAAARHSANGMDNTMLLSLIQAGIAEGFKSQDASIQEIITRTSAISSHLLEKQYSRKQEFEADKYGMKYMALAGYNTDAAVDLQRMFVNLSKGQDESWATGLLRTHPPSRKRVEANLQNQALYPKHDFMGHVDYQNNLKTLFKNAFAYELHDKAISSKKPEKAKQWIQEAIKQEPNEALFHASLARIYQSEGKRHKALKSIEKALKLNYNYYDFHLLYAQLNFDAHNTTLAKKHFIKSAKLLDTPVAHYFLGKIYETESDVYLAKAHYRVAAQIDSDFSSKAAFRYAELDFPDNPQVYVHIAPYVKDDKIWYRIRSKAPMKTSELKVTVFSGKQLLETFYLPSLEPDVAIDHLAKLPLSLERLEQAHLRFSLQPF